MANNYLEFSEEITNLTQAEADWLREQLAEVTDDDWTGPRFLLDGHTEDDMGWCGFGYAFEDQSLWLHSDESGDPERVAILVQKFLQRFRPNGYWSLTYATFCSKPRIGEFGGGSVVVTAKRKYWSNAHDAVQSRIRRLQQSGLESA